jgi:Zn finger protein HypA/HybF involved in hydrogenase expression
MRERRIVKSLIDTVRKELRGYPDNRASRIGLRIGEFTGIDEASLRSCFDAPVKLEIEWCQAGIGGCLGNELDLAYVELEQPQEVGV